MFLSGSTGTANTVKRLRHDLLLHYNNESLFEGTDRTFSQVYVECPYPVHKPLKISEDSVKILLKEKQQYSKLFDVEKRRFKFDNTNIEKKKYAGSEYMYLPRYVLELYQQNDPDPFFNCDYNYYFTGGVLEHIEFNNADYFICPDADNNLCVTDISNSCNDAVKLNYSLPTLIYGMNSLKTEEGLFLVLREKQKVSVLRFDDISSINLVWSKDYKVPIFDAKLSEDEPIHLGVILFNKFIVENIRINTRIFRFDHCSRSGSDNFQQFQFLGNTLVVLMDRYSVKILDYRAQTEEATFDLKLIDCNSLCTFNILENTLLLASRHYIMKTDLRSLSESFHYSHSLDEPACYMDFAVKGQDTYLCVSGQNVHSKVLFTGNAPYSLPYKVPSISDTFKETRLAYPSLVLEKYLDDRLNYSTTGLKVLNLDEEIYIFSSNCLGEIFKQKVSNEEMNAERPVKVLFDWVNDQKKPDPELYVTLVEEMSKARFALNCNPIDHNLKKIRRERKTSEFLAEFAPRFKKKNVQGTLAVDFLSVWEDDEEEEDEQMNDLPETPFQDKVHGWIQDHDFSDDNNISFS